MVTSITLHYYVICYKATVDFNLYIKLPASPNSKHHSMQNQIIIHSNAKMRAFLIDTSTTKEQNKVIIIIIAVVMIIYIHVYIWVHVCVAQRE